MIKGEGVSVGVGVGLSVGVGVLVDVFVGGSSVHVAGKITLVPVGFGVKLACGINKSATEHPARPRLINANIKMSDIQDFRIIDVTPSRFEEDRPEFIQILSLRILKYRMSFWQARRALEEDLSAGDCLETIYRKY